MHISFVSIHLSHMNCTIVQSWITGHNVWSIKEKPVQILPIAPVNVGILWVNTTSTVNKINVYHHPTVQIYLEFCALNGEDFLLLIPSLTALSFLYLT